MPDTNKVVIKINYQNKEKNIDKKPDLTMVTEWNVKRILSVLFLLVTLLFLSGYLLFKQQGQEFSSYSEEINKSINKPEKKINQLKNIAKETIEESSSNKVNLSYINTKKEIDLVLESNNEPVLLKEKKDIVKSDNNIDSINNTSLVKNTDIILNTPIEKEINLLGINNSLSDIKDNLILSEDTRVVRALLTSSISNKEPQDTLSSPVILSDNKASGIIYFTELINMKGEYVFHEWWWQDKMVFKKKISILGDRWRASTSKLIGYSKIGIWNVRLVNKESVILNNLNFEVVLE